MAGACAICSLLPIWEVWYIGTICATVDRGSFWSMLWQVYGPPSVRGGVPWSGGYGGYSTGVAITAVAAVVVGAICYLKA
jgi:hypothetical protein